MALPYLNAVIRSRFGQLLRPADYEKWLSLDYRGVLGELRRRPYGGRVKDEELVELDRILDEEYASIRQELLAMTKRIMKHEKKCRKYVEFLDFYWNYRQQDVLKSIVNLYLSKAPASALSFVLCFGNYTRDYCEELLASRKLSEILEKSFLDPECKRKAMEVVPEAEKLKSALPIFRVIDDFYLSRLMKKAETLNYWSRKTLLPICGSEVDISNILLVTRGKALGLGYRELIELVLGITYRVNLDTLRKAMGMPDVPGVLRVLEGSPYAPYVSRALKAFAEYGPFGVEREMKRILLDECVKAFFGYPFQLGILVAYVNLLRAELENVRTIVIGKRIGIRKEGILPLLIVPPL